MIEAVTGKDIVLPALWIALILVLGGLLWFPTTGLRETALLKTVNIVLEKSGDGRQLEQIPAAFSRRTSQGVWYYQAWSQNRALVSFIMADGILQPCVAWVAPDGRVSEISPLQDSNSLRSVSQGIINAYIRRIEADEKPELKRVASMTRTSSTRTPLNRIP
jgi:hypothetical protein